MAVVGKQLLELPSRVGYLLADKGVAVGFGMWSSEEFGGNMLVGWAADTVGHMPVGMEQVVPG